MASQQASVSGDVTKGESPLSLNRLTAAFAQMLGGAKPDTEPNEDEPTGAVDPCEISPRSIVEAVLFVGGPDNPPRTAEELAQAMRDVSAAEVAEAVAQLNELYQRDATPYHIVEEQGGYRLALREEMLRIRDKFHGRVKETKLSSAAMEVLSIIAYQQPITAGHVEKLRGVRSGSLLASLVRRGLVRLDRSDPAVLEYHTTDRFLRVFGLQAIEQLPRASEMED